MAIFFYQTINKTTGERIPTAYAIHDSHIVLFLEWVKFVNHHTPGGTPAIVRSTVTFSKGRGDVFEAKFLLHLLEHVLVSLQVQLPLW